MPFELSDIVELVEDVEEDGLKKGLVGVVVHVFSGPEGYEVEFAEHRGQIIESFCLMPYQIRPFQYVCQLKRPDYAAYLTPFIHISEGIDQAIGEEFEFCYPDPPTINCMFGDIGSAFFKEVGRLDTDRIRRFLGLVEEGMLSDNEEVSTAMATGLIEAMVNHSFHNMESWRVIEAFLGQESREYAEAWRNYDFGH